MTNFARLFVFTLIAPVFLSGCATYNMTKAAPAQSQPISVIYSSEGPSGWSDLPIGAYRVPKTNVIISGQQSGSPVGGMFGVLGVLAQDTIEAGASARAVKSGESALHVDLVPQAKEIAEKLLAAGRFGQAFAMTQAQNAPTLMIDPYVVITFTSDTEARPFVVLKATLKSGQAGSADWTTRYTASAGKPLPIAGDNGWTANGGQPLNDALAHDLESAIGAMLDDVATRHIRDDGKLFYVEAAYPYLRQRMASPGYELAEDDKSITFVPKFADAMIVAGVHVLDKSVITARPATKDDKFQMLDEGK